MNEENELNEEYQSKGMSKEKGISYLADLLQSLEQWDANMSITDSYSSKKEWTEEEMTQFDTASGEAELLRRRIKKLHTQLTTKK